MGKLKEAMTDNNGDYYDSRALKWLSGMSKQYNQDMEGDTKLVDTNLKTAAARNKPKMSDVPPVALLAMGAAMSDGAAKYGRFNWRDTGTTSSVFYDAMMRHLVDWYNGEDYAHDSHVKHLAHIMASCAILLDAEAQGTLNDDRIKATQSVARNPQLWKETNE